MSFIVPDDYEAKKNGFRVDETGQKWQTFGNICWYTNLDISKRREELVLRKTYNPKDYPKYDNYDAINVNRVADIPADYYHSVAKKINGIMGVPITFFDKYNPEQFEILGSQRWDKSPELLAAYTGDVVQPEKDLATRINGRETYDRIFIRRKQRENKEEHCELRS